MPRPTAGTPGSAARPPLNPLRWSSDGNQWGGGQLWGIAQKAEVLGAFYNKATLKRLGLQVPTTFDQFQQSLAVAKSKGVPPIMVGNLDRWPMGHVFMVLQARFDQAASISNWTYGHAGATFDTAGTRKAATVLQQWSDKGYFEDGFNGVSQENAAARFGKGEGLYFITGPWENQTFAGRSATASASSPCRPLTGRREHRPPARCRCRSTSARTHRTRMWRPPSSTSSPTERRQGRDRQRRSAGRRPGRGVGRSQLVAGRDLGRLDEKSKAGTLTPYLDWATPTMGDTLFGGLQKLSENRETPAEFTAAVQQDWEKTHS